MPTTLLLMFTILSALVIFAGAYTFFSGTGEPGGLFFIIQGMFMLYVTVKIGEESLWEE